MSVTFYPAGTSKVARPLDVLGISASIGRHIAAKFPAIRIHHDDVTNDGDDYFKALGVLNFYLSATTGLNSEAVQAIVASYNAEQAEIIKLRFLCVEKSNSRPCQVARVRVVKNATTQYSEVPELDVSTFTVPRLLQYLADQGVQVDPTAVHGEISADEVKFVLSDSNPPAAAPYQSIQSPLQRQIAEEIAPMGAVRLDCSDFARSIDGYRKRLAEIVAYIDRNDLPNRRICFA